MKTIAKPALFTCLLTLCVAGPLALIELSRAPVEPRETHTTASRLADFGPAARARLSGVFGRAGVPYPPARVRLAAFKQEGRLDLFAAADAHGRELRFIKSYDVDAGPQPMQAAYRGPKLMEGDRRTPEGLYRLEGLNPNSIEHVSIRIGYPNRQDRARAAAAGRPPEALGGDIMLHGGGPGGTEGCLKLTDREVEELFTLLADARADAARAGRPLPADILIAPYDFRFASADHDVLEAARLDAALPEWAPALYAEIDRSLADLPTAEPGARFRTWLAAD
ncbi:MAG: L,D-transpeptidase family protein [Marivibrio sp.]|uniref:L,D-transpeptidase family protein n=1 Tax=Marivibrio sp. TaxID=2039719 RepID=UPI0032EFC261